jgi:hypothetical protein
MLDDHLSLLECHNMSTGNNSTNQGSNIPEDIISKLTEQCWQLKNIAYKHHLQCLLLFVNKCDIISAYGQKWPFLNTEVKKWPLTDCLMKLWLCYPHDSHVRITNEIC